MEIIMKNDEFNFEYTPCSRVLNGFRLEPTRTPNGFIWSVRPNHSIKPFYFPSLQDAEHFAKSFCNNHRDSFWHRRWIPLYSFDCAFNLVKNQFGTN